MVSKCDTVPIYYVHVDALEELRWAVDCFILGYFGVFIKVPYRGWWCTTNGEVTMLSYCNEVGVVSEVSTAKGIVEFFWDELAFTPLLCCIRGVSWAYI